MADAATPGVESLATAIPPTMDAGPGGPAGGRRVLVLTAVAAFVLGSGLLLGTAIHFRLEDARPAIAAPGGWACGAEKCAPFSLRDATRADPLELLPQAKAFARTVDGSSQLFRIASGSVRGGVVDLSRTGVTIAYTFAIGPRAHRTSLIVVAIAGSFMATRVETALPDDALPEPRCSVKAASAAAIAGGMARDETISLFYAVKRKQDSTIVGTVTAFDATHILTFDALTCGPES
jgi:hypothetical protein